jgi:hypothetical protein
MHLSLRISHNLSILGHLIGIRELSLMYDLWLRDFSSAPASWLADPGMEVPYLVFALREQDGDAVGCWKGGDMYRSFGQLELI